MKGLLPISFQSCKWTQCRKVHLIEFHHFETIVDNRLQNVSSLAQSHNRAKSLQANWLFQLKTKQQSNKYSLFSLVRIENWNGSRIKIFTNKLTITIFMPPIFAGF